MNPTGLIEFTPHSGTQPTYQELIDRVEELEAFKRDWEPFLIEALQALVAASKNPMLGAMGFALPPQVQNLINRVNG